jgi:hypothetical protein
MLHILYVVCLKRSVNGTRKKNKTEDTNKLTLLTFKMVIILHNTRGGNPRTCDSCSAIDS